MFWANLLAGLINAVVVLIVFGFTAYAVFILGFSGWWFVLATFVCGMADVEIKGKAAK